MLAPQDFRATTYEQADALVAKAGSDPLAAAGANLAADQLRQQTDAQAQGRR